MDHRYRYKGPVVKFDKVVTENYVGETVAESQKKAMSNIIFNYKKDNNLLPTVRVTLIPKYLKELEAIG